MPFYVVDIMINKYVSDDEESIVHNLDDKYRVFDMKETMCNFHCAFDMTINFNDHGELSVVFNIYKFYELFIQPLNIIDENDNYFIIINQKK